MGRSVWRTDSSIAAPVKADRQISQHRKRVNVTTLHFVTGGFNYDLRNLETSIVPACRAVAFHNIQPTVCCAGQKIPKITQDSEPLTYLSVLCDELQIWDRSPAGIEHLTKYRTYAKSHLMETISNSSATGLG
jgi:hypothetical protein